MRDFDPHNEIPKRALEETRQAHREGKAYANDNEKHKPILAVKG